MSKEFGVKLAHYEPVMKCVAVMEDGSRIHGGDEIFELDWKSILGACWQEDSWETMPLYIHPDSHHTFEPQVGDLKRVWQNRKMEQPEDYIYISDGGSLHPHAYKFEIIQRNNKPFFWPEKLND